MGKKIKIILNNKKYFFLFPGNKYKDVDELAFSTKILNSLSKKGEREEIY